MAQSEKEILDGLAEIVNEETGLDTASVELDKSFDDEVKNLKTVRDAVTFITGAQS